MVQKTDQDVDAATRQRHVAEWSKSGMSKRAYCVKNGITLNQLTYWQKLAGGRRGRTKSAFVRATVGQEPALVAGGSTQVARLMVGGGSVLEICSSVDPVWAARLISAVGGRL